MTDKEIVQCLVCGAAAFVVGLLVGQGKLRLPGRAAPAEAAAAADPMAWFTEWGKRV